MGYNYLQHQKFSSVERSMLDHRLDQLGPQGPAHSKQMKTFGVGGNHTPFVVAVVSTDSCS